MKLKAQIWTTGALNASIVDLLSKATKTEIGALTKYDFDDISTEITLLHSTENVFIKNLIATLENHTIEYSWHIRTARLDKVVISFKVDEKEKNLISITIDEKDEFLVNFVAQHSCNLDTLRKMKKSFEICENIKNEITSLHQTVKLL